jgi:RsiW-degrading membrane proteinase PrsW (M82 family)
MLERLFVFGFIVTTHWEAVGFFLAAKSVFRFGDLKEAKDRKLTEYMLIGTLLSFGFAILISLIYMRLISALKAPKFKSQNTNKCQIQIIKLQTSQFGILDFCLLSWNFFQVGQNRLNFN